MTNYKTTIAGVLAAIVLAIEPFVSANGFNLKTDWPKLAGAVLVAIFGLVAKDHDVTGGTRPQPGTAASPQPAAAATQTT